MEKKIALLGLIVAIIGIAVSISIPEIRCFLGLESSSCKDNPQLDGINKKPTSDFCVSVNSREGWQKFNLQDNFTKVTRISGSWSVDARNYASVNASGHNGDDAKALAPYNQYKYDRRFPFGALLMASGQEVWWIQYPGELNNSVPFNVVKIRINDADNLLIDNEGMLQVCFGN